MHVLSPLVSERIWALPVSPASVKFLNYLIHKSEFGGHLAVRQADMASDYGVSRQAVSLLLNPLIELGIVLRSPGGSRRAGNDYRLHPLAAKYSDADSMEAAFLKAFHQIKDGELVNLRLPTYTAVPPATDGKTPNLQVA